MVAGCGWALDYGNANALRNVLRFLYGARIVVAMQPLQNLDLLDLQLTASIKGDFDEAWRIAEILKAERPNDVRAKFNRAWHLMRRGDLLGGFEHLEYGRDISVFGSGNFNTDKPRWLGKESLVGKAVLLRGEGGFGDEIINVRFAKDLAQLGARVIASCNGGLMNVLKTAPGVSQVIPHGAEASVYFDYWVPAMSAVLALGITYGTLSGEPYLSPDPAYVEKWSKKIIGPGLKVGIRWSGNPKFEHEQNRRFPPEPMFALSELPGATLYSLQRDSDIRDLPDEIIDLQHELATWDDTAGAIANLDLVITSCTSIAHLAAAMGKETWVIPPVLPYQVWALPGNTSPWYESVRLFRQEVFGNWDAPLSRVREALAAKLGTSATAPRATHISAFASAPSKPSHWDTISSPQSASQPAARPPAPEQPLFPGLVVAPYPKAHIGQGRSTTHTLHFIAGLPRSGSTALLSLMAQNSRIYAAPISGLSGMFSGIHANWDVGDFHKELPRPDAKRRVLRALLEQYHETDRPVILDKERQWIQHIALLEEVLERPVKMIIPVRPLPEILASFEMLRRRQPIEMTGADAALGPSSTLATRAEYFMGSNGPVGMAMNAMGDAVHMGYINRLLFVDYNRLMTAPKMQLRRIYDFLEEPNFEHDFGNIKQIAQGDWRVHKFPGLHDIRPEFKKESTPARDALGPEVYGRYNQPEPWLNWI